ncbi:MAG TPA: DUF2207 domain-containing protein [Clostridiales bacterium]|nr:MAG: hypothetical protein BWY37_00965 [Firmicutes bacterium ADurb.Bin262]HOU11117.1 DUF2207 domain-containing protein [Clostridiales bacterium]
MKKALRIFAAVPVFLLIASLCALSAAGAATQQNKLSADSAYDSYAYLLDSYDIRINVNEDNSFDITERIEAYFHQARHGIYREIPLKNKVERLDGTTSFNRAKITNVSVDAPFTSSVSDGYRVLKIGEEDVTVTGPKNYQIAYTYHIGRDTGKGYDEFYFNLIGDHWDTPVGNVTFTIVMPKTFDAAKLGFAHGYSGSTDSGGITYEVKGNVITGRYEGVLNAGEALTVRVQLPEGYFVKPAHQWDLPLVLSFTVPVLLMLLTVFLWMKVGRDDMVVEPVEFYPPKGLNSAEVGFIYKGKAEASDVVSLLIYLAGKGYLKITEFEQRSLFMKTKAFKLTKLKEYDGDNLNERIFLSGLFSTPKKPTMADLKSLLGAGNAAQTADYSVSRDEVTSEDLKNSFYVTLNKIVQNLNSKENRYGIFEKSSLGKGFFVGAMILAVYALITVRPVLEYGGSSLLPIALLFPAIGFSAMAGMLFGKTKIPLKIFGLVWGLGFGGAPWVSLVLPALLVDYYYLAAYIVGLACVFVMVMMLKVMPKRTPYGNEMLGKIRGFKNFLEFAEKPKLEELVLQDPSYFYDILPYTYVLGVSELWIKKFEMIALQPPDWYAGSAAFNAASFGSFMNETMTSAVSAMSSSPSGGSSGGGSSGGGSGGGGGGSW